MQQTVCSTKNAIKERKSFLKFYFWTTVSKIRRILQIPKKFTIKILQFVSILAKRKRLNFT